MSEPEPVLPTPLEEAPAALGGGRRLWLKREDLHELGAFKWRGALPALRAYRERGAEAVVTASTGNHGAATAWAAERTGTAGGRLRPARRERDQARCARGAGRRPAPGGRRSRRVEGAGARICAGRGPAVLRGRRRAGPVQRLRGDRARDRRAARRAPGADGRPGGQRRTPDRRRARRGRRRHRRRRQGGAGDGLERRRRAAGRVRSLRDLRGRDGRAGGDPARGRGAGRPRHAVRRGLRARDRHRRWRLRRGGHPRGGLGRRGAGRARPGRGGDGAVVLIVTGSNIDPALHERAVKDPQSFSD